MSSPVTMQPETISNWMAEEASTLNKGTNTYISTRLTSGSNRRSTIAFDFSSLVPAGATITLATLKLYCYAYVAARTLTISRLLRADWVEAQATWNIYKTGSNWGTAGCLNSTTDFTATDAATASLTGTGWLTWDVTNQVKTAFASVSGVAHFVLGESGGTTAAVNSYYNRRYTTNTALRPILYIEYTVPSAVLPNFLPFFWA